MGKYISSLFEPTIKLEEQSLEDFSYGTAGYAPGENRSFESRGVTYPYVSLNSYTFGPKEIIRCEIDCTEFIPKLYLKVMLLSSGEFLSKSFPKDGDIVSIYIRGRDDLFKPIRNDYVITSVSTSTQPNTSSDGRGSYVTVAGELNIPGIYDEVIFMERGTSYNVMKDLAKSLGLGFATNEDNTDDEMNWINPNDSTLEFMKHITGAAWKDENSFFTFFIDMYYHLNFINVNDLISYDADTLLALAENTLTGAQFGDDEIKKALVEKCFTNHPNQRQNNFFMKRFKPINESSQISKTYGYAFNPIFYEHSGKEVWQLQAKSLITSGAEKEKIILRGKADDDSYNTLQKYNYVGIQHNGPDHNVHENFYFARAHNLMNNLEMDKLNVEVELNKFNLNIYRYENVPTIFFITNDVKRIKEQNMDVDPDPTKDTDEAVPIAVDKFYTGHYLIKGMTVEYAPSGDESELDAGINETLVLTRREWPSPTNA